MGRLSKWEAKGNFMKMKYKFTGSELRNSVENEIKKFPFYEDTIQAYMKFAKGEFRTLNDRMTPLERLQDHYFRIQASKIYIILRRFKIVP
jgi:hypothetical protein